LNAVLIASQVYRHLLFNRLPPTPTLDRSIARLGILLLLFDVYLTWARIEKLGSNAQILQAQPLVVQYLFFLALVAGSTLAFHVPIRLLCNVNLGNEGWGAKCWRRIIPYYPYPTPLSTALLVSSCTKLFPILLIIWDYDLPSSATAVSWAVIVNNVAALEILMDCGYVRAGVLVGVGAAVRSAVAWAMLWGAGLGTGWEGYDAVQSVREWIGEMGALL
jgi:hypothetical protein